MSVLLCAKHGCCKVSSHGFGVFFRALEWRHVTSAKQPITTNLRLQRSPYLLVSLPMVTRVFQHCVFSSNVSFVEFTNRTEEVVHTLTALFLSCLRRVKSVNGRRHDVSITINGELTVCLHHTATTGERLPSATSATSRVRISDGVTKHHSTLNRISRTKMKDGAKRETCSFTPSALSLPLHNAGLRSFVQHPRCTMYVPLRISCSRR